MTVAGVKETRMCSWSLRCVCLLSITSIASSSLTGNPLVHNDSATEWLTAWAREVMPNMPVTAFPQGLVQDWHHTANRAGLYHLDGEAWPGPPLGPHVDVAAEGEGRSERVLPPASRGFRSLLKDLLTTSECNYFREFVNGQKEFNEVSHGKEVSLLPKDFPPAVLERLRTAVTSAVAKQHAGASFLSSRSTSNTTSVSILSQSSRGVASASSRGPIQFLSAQVIKRMDGGSFAPHVDSSMWYPPCQCRVPVMHNSLSAYTMDIFLSDPNSYGDGEIEFIQPPYQALKQPQGDGLVFASDVTNPHQVRPVRGGARFALVVWWHDDPALAPAQGLPTPDVSEGVSPHLEAASHGLQEVSHLRHVLSESSWTNFLTAASKVAMWQ